MNFIAYFNKRLENGIHSLYDAIKIGTLTDEKRYVKNSTRVIAMLGKWVQQKIFGAQANKHRNFGYSTRSLFKPAGGKRDSVVMHFCVGGPCTKENFDTLGF